MRTLMREYTMKKTKKSTKIRIRGHLSKIKAPGNWLKLGNSIINMWKCLRTNF